MEKSKDIEKWLNKYDIKDYSISENNLVTVFGNVNLKNKLKENILPIRFEQINGYFDISNNKLESLEGCPKTVQKDFDCSNNKLTSLFGGPVSVGDFNCSNNNLKDLSYLPKNIDGDFNCSSNSLTSINGSPRTIQGHFNCSSNHINSLKNGPKYIKDFFDCSNNKIEYLNGGPITVGQDFICHWNELKGLNDIASEISWDIITDISLNHINSISFDEKKKVWRYKGHEVLKHIYKPIVAISNKEDIQRWLIKHDIKNFTILEDNSINVKGDVKLSNLLENLSKLPVNFNEVDGDFDISDNVLTSIEGSPQKVSGDFKAHKNEINSLKGGPKEVGKNFIILKNNIRSLENAPSVVGDDFICSHNPLNDLEGIKNVGNSVFSSVYISALNHIEFSYHSLITYKYKGSSIMEYLDKEYVILSEEEKIFEKTRENLSSVISKMIDDNSIKIEMINENLLKNLTKYNLVELRKRVLLIKEPKIKTTEKELTEEEIKQSVFDSLI